MSGSGQTTSPAFSTEASSEVGSLLAVHWIFPDAKGTLTPLVKPRVLFGRADDCDFVLQGTEASRYHAEVVRDGPLRTIVDLNSTNGVFVNGEKVAKAPLIAGDLIRLGEWLGLIVRVSGNERDNRLSVRSIAQDFFGGFTLDNAVEPARRAAAANLPIVVQGETGSGKERLARAIHAWSGRSGDFLAVNCAALPENLAEGELFGYRKGAFTGADRSHLGYFRSANNGTLLLDEIVDLAASLQAKLLRVLEQREVTPLGESRPVAVDVRVLAATQEPLSAAVSERRFRADLFARLDGLIVTLPPLRERVEDIPGLFARFLQESSGGKPPAVEPKLVEQLCLYDWPYNVRELALQARRLLALHGHEALLHRSHLSVQIRLARTNENNETTRTSQPAKPAEESPENFNPKDRNKRELTALIKALREHRGNVARAAASIGISRQRAYRIMDGQSELDLEAFRNHGK